MSQEKEKKGAANSSGDLEEKVLYINRCSKVVKGGRKFSFSALILVGDYAGRVGFGFAKANELSDAIRKGGELARKGLLKVVMDKGTIPHEAQVKWDGSLVFMKPAPEGAGVVAGSKVRAILEMAGVKNVVAKTHGSSNPLNQVRATFKALQTLRKREELIQQRGLA